MEGDQAGGLWVKWGAKPRKANVILVTTVANEFMSQRSLAEGPASDSRLRRRLGSALSSRALCFTVSPLERKH